MEYHSNRFKDASYLVLKKNNVVAVLPANSVDDIIHSHQGLSYGGLILKPSLKLNEVILIFEALLNQLSIDGFKTLDLKFIPDFYALQSTNELKYLVHILNAELYKRDVLSVLDLKSSLPYNSSTKQAIKQAEDQSFEVKEVDEVASFWNELLIPNLKKRHQAKPVHSASEMQKLKQRFPFNIRQFNVYNDDLLISGCTVFETKTTAHVQYIAGSAVKSERVAIDYLHHYLISRVFNEKDFFDFGASTTNKGKNINEGLLFWKERFGARTYTQDFIRINLNKSIQLKSILE
ncbi:MAG: GNAT family N-acetyltransferase [Flavobacteriaceae bacterium]